MVNDFQLSESYSFFEKHLYGTRNLEFAIITKKNESILDSINLFQIEKFTKYLENQPQTGFVYSPSTLVKNWNRAKNGLSWDHYIIPDANSLEKIKTLVNKHNKNVMMRCIDSTNHMGRVLCTLEDMGSEDLFHYIEKAVSWISKNNDNPNLSFRVTGIVYLSEKSENKLISNMILNLFIAIVIISLMMGLLYRSYKIMFIAIIPNIFSLVLLAGIIGYFNIELSATISVIFTVSYVIIVDDTIHFLTRYRFERVNHNTEQAIKKTFIKVGKPIIITSIIMMAGFIAPIFSEFQDIYYTGILTMITLAIALLANLIILPLLIDW
jgi:predicted RND superfamily exporter protein